MGIKVCASQNENTNFGPVISSFGVNPLKNDIKPSFRAILDTMRKPLSGFSKFLFFCGAVRTTFLLKKKEQHAEGRFPYLFWIRVLMTSSGAETIREAEAPAMEAMKFWDQVAAL